ncbi:hypothetical protein HBI25_026040 [Parastagonospora nodorum]|nr:hypothetical protein HBI10_042330 [Parastagonospora nodorum]KAH4030860.1 hypothetical protein HBI13_025780 [Parastagonospora nodorum]KAH4056287.1 hypothetical protein HBH49_051600 [Parastagonospora nodorum]KAH4196700.1 hypothetical protein HBH42_069050 [Parastagonospora nodorum]KAH4858292.1 hypothetical protein HBH75_060070 [Parastagonospora nodorum]
MQCNTPSPTPPTSPTSTCKWKRARPVYAPYGSTKSMVTSISTPPRPSLPSPIVAHTSFSGSHVLRRYVSTGQRAVSAEDAEAEVSISEALYRTSLEDPPQRMLLTATTSIQGQHGTSTVNDPETLPDHVDPAIPPQESHDMSQASNSDYVPSQEEEMIANEQLQEEKEDEDASEVEEHIDLDFQIPKETLRAAMLASPQTRASFWSAKMYRGPEDQSLSTHYCRSLEVSERVAQHFLKEKVLGFDIEWRPFGSPNSIKHNASLIQLACEDRIALFHISQFTGATAEELMPPTLKKILETPDILKVGVAVKGDFTRLERYLNIQPQGVFELSRLHNLVEGNITSAQQVSNKLVGLAAQVLQHLQLPLYKGEQLADDPADTASVRESDWSKPLDLQQIQYAAADAYAGFRLYDILEYKRKQMRPTPPTRGLCDYDSKRAPKPKTTTKKTAKKAKIPVPATSVEGISSIEQDVDQQIQQEPIEVDGSEEEEGYETAPEDLLDSHELEDPAQASASQEETHVLHEGNTVMANEAKQKRVGRVNFQWLRGPDPEYPQLPQHPEDCDIPVASASSDPSFESSATNQQVADMSNAKWPEPSAIEDFDEFADPELEEALQVLDIDEDGKLIDAPVPTACTVKAKRTRKVPSTSRHPEPDPISQAEVPKDLDLSDYNPISLDTQEPLATSSPNTIPLPVTADEPSHSSEFGYAVSWAQTYLESTVPSPSSTAPSRIRATIPHLRAYHLWHHQSLSIDEVAGHLRDPPLSHSTVTGYILQAVALERFEYDHDKLRDIMMGLPVGMRKGRFKWIAEKVGL